MDKSAKRLRINQTGQNGLINRMKIPKNYPRHLFLFTVFALSLVSFVYCWLDTDAPQSYQALFLLPLFHGIATLLFFHKIFRGNFYLDLPVLIIFALFTIRNAVTPLVMATIGYQSMFGIPSNGAFVQQAVWTMIYDTFVVLIVIVRSKSKEPIQENMDQKRWMKGGLSFYILILCAILFSVMAFFVTPELRTQYYSIFTSDITHLAQEKFTYSGGIQRIFSTAGEMIISATRLVVSAILIVWLRKRGECPLYYICCLMIILMQFLFMTDSNAYVLLLCFSLYLLTYRLFPHYAKKTIKGLVLVVIVFGYLLYLNRFSQDHYGQSLPTFLQAYFPGISNFCGVEKLFPRTLLDSFRQIGIDLYAAVPFRTTLFGYSGGLTDVSSLWNKANQMKGQIMPNTAQSYYYFGSFLSPLLSGLLAWISMSSFQRAKRTDNPMMFTTLVFLAVHSAVSIVMYNFYIFSCAFTQWILFMLLFSFLAEDSFKKILGEKHANEHEVLF